MFIVELHFHFYCVSGKREIQQLQVRCANTERNCQWTGTVSILDDHIASCKFALVPCPNKCEEHKGAGEMLLIRKHLDQHLKTKCPKRSYECPHCGEKGTFASITEEHDQVCEKKMVACSNKGSGCSLSMERGKVKEHVSNDCEYTEVACVYESLGCEVRMLRKDKATHENKAREKHMDLSMVNVKLMSIEQKTLTATVKLSEEKHRALKNSITLKDEQHQTLTEEHIKFSTKNEALTMRLSKLSDKHVSLSRKHETLSKKHKTLSKKHETLSKKHETLLVQHRILSDTVNSHEEQHKVQTRKQKFTFKLSHYTSKKEKNEIFLSTPFYTYSGGYKMCIRVDANGNDVGKDSHISIFTTILAGSYDNELRWPFLGTVTYELLNQLEDNNHHSTDNTFMASSDMRVGISRGQPKFFPHSSLGHNPATNTQYLLDDTLYFVVSVEMDNHKPWLICTEPINTNS